MPISFSSLSGGSSSAVEFSLSIESSEDTTYTLGSEYPAGNYFITSTLADTSYDIYLIDSNANNVGYTSDRVVTASAAFNQVVVYGTTQDDVILFQLQDVAVPSTNSLNSGAAPKVVSVSSALVANPDDSVTVNGRYFAPNVEFSFISTVDGTEYAAKNVVRNSSTSATVTRPDTFPSDKEPYTLVANNPGLPNPATNDNKLLGSIVTIPPKADVLVIAGGGGASTSQGGGGAGGYVAAIDGETGPDGSTNTPVDWLPGASFTVTVGAGGAGDTQGNQGTGSVFGTLAAIGGGYGGINPSSGSPIGGSGGSGGGGGASWNNSTTGSGGAGTSGQGKAGGSGHQGGFAGSARGGGGGAGQNGISGSGGSDGGDGLQTSITGTPTYFAGGGGGAIDPYNGNDKPTGGLGGGGEGGKAWAAPASTPGEANTGGGGGAGDGSGQNGGSGIVILSYLNSLPEISSIDPGLTYSMSLSGNRRVYQFTAGTGSITV